MMALTERLPAEGADRREDAALLTVEGLTVAFGAGRARREVVHGVSFTVRAGESLALVGESGSGKSVIARSLVGLAGPGASVRAERLDHGARPLLSLTEREWRRLRGRTVGFVLQDALVSLDPLRRIAREIAEPLLLHRTVERGEAAATVLGLLREVGVPEPEVRAAQYPHQLSGGLRQRALIASAIACAPPLLIADEPTTALDAIVQRQILDLLAERRARGTGLLLISHDLSVVARLADRTAVVHSGRIVEYGPTAAVLADPRHPYTRALLAAVPGSRPRGERLFGGGFTVGEPGETIVHPEPAVPAGPGTTRPVTVGRAAARPPAVPVAPVTARPARSSAAPAGAARAAAPEVTARTESDRPPVLEAVGLAKGFAGPGGTRRQAVDGVGFVLRPGRTVGLVGESGSGKSTVARLVLGLEAPDAGRVLLDGEPWSERPERERRPHRARIQAVFQDPLGSFDPRHTVGRILADSLRLRGLRGAAAQAEALGLLAQVGLDEELLGRRPLRLSGGQRQRVAIARALATRPDVIVCDEPVSALDVSVQAQVLDLLVDLQRELGVAYLFISHDLGVIRHLSDHVLVMKDGRVVESGAADQVLDRPAHPYTRELLDAVTTL